MSAPFLSQPPEYYAADFLETHWGTVQPSVGGLSLQWNTSGDIPLSTNWPAGDTYPIITLTNRDVNVLGGGDTNYSSMQGDGSGSNQHRLENFLLTVHTDSAETYGVDDVGAETYAWRLTQHIDTIVEQHGTDPPSDDIAAYYFEPAEGSIPNQGSTEVTHQEQGTFTVDWHHTP